MACIQPSWSEIKWLWRQINTTERWTYLTTLTIYTFKRKTKSSDHSHRQVWPMNVKWRAPSDHGHRSQSPSLASCDVGNYRDRNGAEMRKYLYRPKSCREVWTADYRDSSHNLLGTLRKLLIEMSLTKNRQMACIQLPWSQCKIHSRDTLPTEWYLEICRHTDIAGRCTWKSTTWKLTERRVGWKNDWVVGWLVGWMFNVPAACQEYLSAWTIVCAATLRNKLHMRFVISSSHGILTPGQPVLPLTL